MTSSSLRRFFLLHQLQAESMKASKLSTKSRENSLTCMLCIMLMPPTLFTSTMLHSKSHVRDWTHSPIKHGFTLMSSLKSLRSRTWFFELSKLSKSFLSPQVFASLIVSALISCALRWVLTTVLALTTFPQGHTAALCLHICHLLHRACAHRFDTRLHPLLLKPATKAQSNGMERLLLLLRILLRTSTELIALLVRTVHFLLLFTWIPPVQEASIIEVHACIMTMIMLLRTMKDMTTASKEPSWRLATMVLLHVVFFAMAFRIGLTWLPQRLWVWVMACILMSRVFFKSCWNSLTWRRKGYEYG